MKEEIIKMARASGFSINDGIVTGGVVDLVDFFHMAQAAEREKLKTLTNEQIEKVIKDNMMFSMNLAGMRCDLVELVEARGQA